MSLIIEKINEIVEKEPYVADFHIKVNDFFRFRASNGLELSDLMITDEIFTKFSNEFMPPDIHKKTEHENWVSWMHKISNGEGEADLATEINGIRYRVNYFIQKGNPAVVMRKLNAKIPEFATIGLPETVLDFVNRSSGLVLITGETGSGKSTTLASIVDFINRTKNCHIVTVEDPVEYLHINKNSTITQREVGANKDTKSFHTGLRAALRQDPDIIMVGEIRDRDTAQMAFEAAETGHLVLSTLHTGSARESIQRMTDFFPGDERDFMRKKFSRSLSGVVTQVLIKASEGKGKVLGYEIMENNEQVRSLIRDDKIETLRSTMAVGNNPNIRLLSKTLAILVKEGKIDKISAYSAAYDPNELKTELHRIGA